MIAAGTTRNQAGGRRGAEEAGMKKLLMIAVVTALAVSAQGDRRERGESQIARTGLVDHAVTIEGVGVVRAYADKCRLEFGIFADSGTAESALAGLKVSRDAFTSAIASALGTTPQFTYDMPKAARVPRGGDQSGPWRATQTASFRLDYVSKEDQNVRDVIGKLTAAACASGTIQGGAEWPRTVFEVSQPAVFEDRLVSMAAASAKERAAKVARTLGRTAGEIRAAGASRTVLAGGREFVLDGYTPVESETPEVDIVYTMQVAFDLAP